MHFLTFFDNQIIKHDLVNKYRYKNFTKLPKLKKITFNLSCINLNIQQFAVNLLALEIITSKKSCLTTSKSSNVLLKVQKGQPTGCKVTIKKKHIYKFLEQLILNILPKFTNFSGFKIETTSSTFSFKLFNKEIMLPELEKHYPLFDNLPVLDIQITTNAKNYKELLFLAKAIKMPVQINSKIT